MLTPLESKCQLDGSSTFGVHPSPRNRLLALISRSISLVTAALQHWGRVRLCPDPLARWPRGLLESLHRCSVHVTVHADQTFADTLGRACVFDEAPLCFRDFTGSPRKLAGDL